MVVVLLPTFVATLSMDSSNNITTDQLALLSLKSHITNDPQNLLASNWSTATSVCNWNGVTCGSRHRRVTSLNLSYMGLTGTLQPHLGDLSNLKYLYLDQNQLSCNLPSEIFDHLPKLQELDLSSNNISGRIPNALFKCKELTLLYLNNNSLEGNVPIEIGNLTMLNWLYLQENNLKGSIPSSMFNLSLLQQLGLGSNIISGDLSSHMFDLLSQLWFIDLGENQFSGIIPTSLFKCKELVTLALHYNQLEGTIPLEVGNLTSLELFYINKNNLTGLMPQSLVNCKDIEVLDFGFNKFNDTFPTWLENLKNLQILLLRSNRFYGHIANPKMASSFSHLRIIDLSDNDFSGCLPMKFFENLQSIINGVEKKREAEYMSYEVSNMVTYYEEALFVTIKRLKTKLTKISTSLTVVDFSSNRFNGKIPVILGELGSLKVLNLSHNSLTGPIPSSFSNLSELESLDLSSNKLEGRIPPQLVNLYFLEVLDLSWNNLVGLIPRGNQFDTFTNSSFNGNLGLCGFPLTKDCGDDQDLNPIPKQYDDTRRELNWKFSILMGYGCGVAFGLFMGYIVFKSGKPLWLIQIIEGVQQKYVERKIQLNAGSKKYS
ncbi:hypothetical protein PTKIN_Ptkin14bG0182200 [Pterospermum kingtungense]